MILYSYGDDVDEENKTLISETHPCDKKAINWCCRMTLLIFSTFALFSMTVVAWNQYSSLINEEDNGTPTIVAMLNECNNQSWNLQSQEVGYKILYYTNTDMILFPDTDCLVNIDFPNIVFNSSTCCRLVLYNTL